MTTTDLPGLSPPPDQARPGGRRGQRSVPTSVHGWAWSVLPWLQRQTSHLATMHDCHQREKACNDQWGGRQKVCCRGEVIDGGVKVISTL